LKINRNQRNESELEVWRTETSCQLIRFKLSSRFADVARAEANLPSFSSAAKVNLKKFANPPSLPVKLLNCAVEQIELPQFDCLPIDLQ
jgi:hypothetical protein